MNKLIVVYNTCGISGRDIKNVRYYKKAINTLLDQDLKFKIVISMCLNSPEVKLELTNIFKDRGVSFNFIEEKLPVNVTFNHSVLKMVKEFGEAEGYLYVDSGICVSNKQLIKNLYDTLANNFHYSMIAAESDTDTGYGAWFGRPRLPGKDKEFLVPVGKTINLHMQLFSNYLFKMYGNRILPDIFASHCTESVFSFLCAAIRTNFCVCRGKIVEHVPDMDLGSSGFRKEEAFARPWNHVFRSKKDMIQILGDPMAKACGFGYEECQKILMHDESQFDENFFCKNDILKDWIKKNLYLTKEELNYDKIIHTFVP